MSDAGFIYALGAKDMPYVKIGSTITSVEARMRVLQTGHPVTFYVIAMVHVTQSVRRVEKRIHRLLKASRCRGEWFSVDIDQRLLEELVCQAQVSLVQDDARPKKVSCVKGGEAMAWSLGQRIRLARVTRNKTAKEIYEAAGIGQSHLSMIEHDQHLPSALVIRKLAQALHVRSDYLLGLSNTIDPDPDEKLAAEEPVHVTP